MPDEIDLLRTFRADTPAPGEENWNRARAAIALAEATAPAAASSRPRRRIPRLGQLPATKGRVILTAAALIIVGVAGGVLTTVLQGPPSLNGPLSTSWEPARPLPGPSGAVTAPSGTWRLMGYLNARGWQENTAGPEPGRLTCPTAQVCYVEGDSAQSASGPADMNSFYASTDGAQTWSVLAVPAGITFTSALACASATSCAAGGLYYGHQPVYLTTGDGGHSWTVRPLFAGVGTIETITCTSPGSCQGLASLTGKPLAEGFADSLSGTRLFRTADGGRKFTVRAFPPDTAVQSIACPTAARCVAVGYRSGSDDRTGPDVSHGFLLTSADGGTTWHQESFPGGYGAGIAPLVECADATHCAMTGFVMRSGTVRDAQGNVTVSGPDAIQYNVVEFSADGGKTWTTSSFPESMPGPMINTLTCPTATTCYAAGSDDIPQQIGNTYNASSAVVAVTRNRGRSWQRVTFSAPAKVPGGMQGDSFMDIGQIECPQASACVATGISDQGSTSTPIYTNHG